MFPGFFLKKYVIQYIIFQFKLKVLKNEFFDDNTNINPVSICNIMIEACLMLNILFLDYYANNIFRKLR